MYSSVSDSFKHLGVSRVLQLADDSGRVTESRLLAILEDPGLARTAEEAATVAAVEECIDQADREIDAFVSVVMPVPLGTDGAAVPGIVANLSGKISAYNLHRRRPHLELGEWKEEYARCIRQLERIAQGKLPLTATAEAPAQAQPVGVTVTAPGRIFGDDLMERY